jgi:hypothetical protein
VGVAVGGISRFATTVAAVISVALALVAWAQEPADEDAPAVDTILAGAADKAATTAATPDTAVPGPFVVPALTPVDLALEAELGSKISTTGERFPIRLTAPILIDGEVAVPAGATGEGEVVHAKKAGGSGAAGELVLAARFLTIGERPLKLRSMRFAVAGRDATNAVNAVNVASAASPLPIGLVGFVITGRNVVYPAGTAAAAKTAEEFVIERVAVVPIEGGAAEQAPEESHSDQ